MCISIWDTSDMGWRGRMHCMLVPLWMHVDVRPSYGDLYCVWHTADHPSHTLLSACRETSPLSHTHTHTNRPTSRRCSVRSPLCGEGGLQKDRYRPIRPPKRSWDQPMTTFGGDFFTKLTSPFSSWSGPFFTPATSTISAASPAVGSALEFQHQFANSAME